MCKPESNQQSVQLFREFTFNLLFQKQLARTPAEEESLDIHKKYVIGFCTRSFKMGLSAYFEEEDSTSLTLVGQECPWNKFHLMIFFLPLLGNVLGENSKLCLFELLWPHPGIPLSLGKIISAPFCLQKLKPAGALWGKSWNGVRSCYMEFSIQQDKFLYTQINGIKPAI